MKDLKLSITLEGLDKASKPFKQLLQSSTKLQKGLGKTAGELKSLKAAETKINGFRDLRKGILLQCSLEQLLPVLFNSILHAFRDMYNIILGT